MNEINFEYYGGEQMVLINSNRMWDIRSNTLCSWISTEKTATGIIVKVEENSNINSRECLIIVDDGSKDGIPILVKQTGYTNFLVDISEYVAIPYTYYTENDVYKLPFRVYGGSTQSVQPNELSDKIEKIWDNSNLFNDYVLNITQDMNGRFIFKHSDYNEYAEYCEKNGIYFQSQLLVKKLTIVNVGKDMMDGYVVFEYKGREYTNMLPSLVSVTYNSVSVININHMSFFDGELNYIDECPIDITVKGDWVNVKYDEKTKKIYLKCKNRNYFSDRRCDIIIKNRLNNKQVFKTILEQKHNL